MTDGGNAHQAIQRPQRQRQELEMLVLDLGKARQGKRVERHQRPADQPSHAAAGPSMDHETHHPAGRCEARHEQEVVGEHRGDAGPDQGRHDDAGNEQVVRVGERQPIGIEDVRVEEVQRVAHDLVRQPRERPLVQDGVKVVVAGQGARRARQRPGVQHRQHYEHRQADPDEPAAVRSRLEGGSVRPCLIGRRHWKRPGEGYWHVWTR